MDDVKKLFFDDIKKYEYLMSNKEKQKYMTYKIEYACIACLLSAITAYFALGIGYLMILCILLLTIIGYKLPYFLLTLRHRQQSNEIIDAIPLWVNTIYSLIGENNIYNAIIKSYESVPIALKYDLGIFIDKIKVNNEDKSAYINFLAVYNVEGFRDIMLKLYEFRNLSKEKLKYEIASLNDTLGNLEKMKRERRNKSELFVVDTVTMILLTVPCMYLFFVSILLSESLL